MNRLTTEDADPQEVQACLDRVLASVAFRSSKRSQDFLRLVVGRTLNGRAEQLRERSIGVEVFGREPDYDTHEDSIVRVKANEIRKRLAQYYQAEGARDPVRIVLPPGSYSPEFQASSALSIQTGAEEALDTFPARKRYRLSAALGVVGVLLAATLAVWLARPASNLDRFWAPMLSSTDTVLFHMGQSVSYQFSRRIQDDYLRKNPELLENLTVYSIPLEKGLLLGPGDIVALHDLTVSTGDATAIANIGSILRQRNRKFEVKFGRVAPGEGGATMAVLVGAFNNPWTLAETRGLRFSYSRELTGEGASWSINDRETGKSWKLWNVHPVQNNGMDYALVTRLVNPGKSSMTLAIGGITQFGTEAASHLITSPHGLDQIAALAPLGWEEKNMQILLQTGVVGRAAVSPEVLLVHVW